MKTAAFDRSQRTAVRHGELKGFIEWLKRQGFANPIVTDAKPEDLGKLGQDDRLYGQLQAGDKILFIQKPAEHGKKPNEFFNIVI